MGLRKTIIVILLLALAVAGVTSAVCVGPSPSYSLTSENPPAEGSGEAVLLFTIGIHVEPLRGQAAGQRDYNDRIFFERHVEDIRILARIVERHGGKLTVQAQTPFTLVAVQSDETLLADLEADGHEIALHFHEGTHLGRNPESLPVSTWAESMTQEISYLNQAGATKVRYWSGGNLYAGILDAASLAGLDVMGDWKNPHSQQTDTLLVGINPWRPSGGPSEKDLSAFPEHDPRGKIIYLPDGQYDPELFAKKRQLVRNGGAQAYFGFIRESLERSLEAAQPGRINVFHFTIHPGEFRGDPVRPYAIVDRFLAEVVDPLVDAGNVRWATFSQMADAFTEWEKTHPGVDPRNSDTASVPSLDKTNLGTVERDLTYCTADGVQLKMDVYLVSLLGLTDPSAGFEGLGGYVDQSSRVQAVVDMFGPTDLTQGFNGANSRILEQVFGATGSDSDILRRASPVTYVSTDDPPFLVLHGEMDKLVPPSQSLQLYDRLNAAHVRATLVIVKNAGHGFAPIVGRVTPTRAEITEMMADFFDRYLGREGLSTQGPLSQPKVVLMESVALHGALLLKDLVRPPIADAVNLSPYDPT